MKTLKKSMGKGLAIGLVAASMLSLSAAAISEPTLANASADTPGQYASDYSSLAETQAAARDLISEIANEGIVLLKNEDNVLPLASGARVTAMGRAYGSPVRDGGGSGALRGTDLNQTWATSLTTAGGFNVGTAFTSNSDGGGNGTISGTNTASSTYTVTDARTTTFNSYSDAAIVFIGRGGAENVMSSTNYSDLSITGIDSPQGHILEFDNNERNLLSIANEYFDDVIVVINADNAMELGELMDGTYENVKAVVWAGIPGPDGCNALGRILSGEVTPSGRLVDTYVRDLTLDPTWQNFGTNSQTGSRYQYLNGTSNADAYGIYYEEGIYLGYKYYETADYEAKQGNYEDFDYDQAVVYPFGYGLSYTSFDWEVLSCTDTEEALTANSEITVKVKVTNTGSVAGKDVVQLYYTPPYTAGGVEKAYKNLGGYAKTKLLRPNEWDIVTLNISLRDMASYDYDDKNDNGFTGYEADAGDYVIRIAHNAHDDESDISLTYTLNTIAQFRYSASTGYEIVNRFDDVTAEFNASATEFSRSDFAGTFPAAPTTEQMTKDAQFINQLSNENLTVANTFGPNANGNLAWKYQDGPDKPWYVEEMPAYGQTLDTTIMLSELTGLEFDDPLWDSFISQLTIAEMTSMVQASAYNTARLQRLGIPQTTDQDGPQTIGGGIPYTTEVVLAATWNDDLAYRMGRLVANEGMWRNIEVWYAPAMNMHRSAFGARNFEYYSEDGYLSGRMGGKVTRGATDKGLVVTLKHFVLNEQETGRSDVSSILNEQAFREIYLKAFQSSVEYGGALGVMTSFNFIGTTWAGGSYALNTEILKNEWGFHGLSVTDYGAGSGMMDLVIRAGSNRGMSSGAPSSTETPTQVAALQLACHEMLYAKANSYAMHTRNAQTDSSQFASIALRTPTLDYANTTHSILMDEEYYADLRVNSSTLGNSVTYAITEGTLPRGLTLSEDGLLSGTPTASGTYEVTVTATGNNLAAASATHTITVAATRINYPAKTLLEGRVGSAYSDSIATATCGQYSLSYALADGSALPEGLTWNEDGTISGTPEVYGEFTVSFVASITDWDGEESDKPAPVSQSFTINIVASDAVLSYESFELGTARAGSSYSLNIARATGSSAITYSFKEGDVIPEGLEIVNGMLVGTPSEAGNYYFGIIASAEGFDDVEIRVNLFVAANDAVITYDGMNLQPARVGNAYTANIATATGSTGIAYSSADLPLGLTLSRDGVLSGTPVAAGEFTFTVTASATGFEPVQAEFTVNVALGIIEFNGTRLADGEALTAYMASVAIDNIGGVTYSVKAGSALPEGLTLNASNGRISGAALHAGQYAVVIVASAEGYEDSEATFLIEIKGDETNAGGGEGGSGSCSSSLNGGFALTLTAGAALLLGGMLIIRRSRKNK